MAFMQTRSGLRGFPPPSGCVFTRRGNSRSIRAQSSSETSYVVAVLAMCEPPCSHPLARIDIGKNGVIRIGPKACFQLFRRHVWEQFDLMLAAILVDHNEHVCWSDLVQIVA